MAILGVDFRLRSDRIAAEGLEDWKCREYVAGGVVRGSFPLPWDIDRIDLPPHVPPASVEGEN